MDFGKIESWILLVFVFFISILLIRWILSIDRILKNQEKANRVLFKMAEKLGIEKSALDENGTE